MRYTAGLIIHLYLLFVAQATNAQADAVAAIRKIYSAYNKDYAIRFSGNMKMYNSNSPAKTIERISASYLLKGKSFKCSIGPVDMLLNEKYYVSVDKSVKIIIVGNKKDLNATMQSPVLNIDQIDKWLQQKNVLATVTRQNGIATLDLMDPKRVTGYDHYRIMYDAQTGFMQKVLLELSDDNDALHKTVVLEINYTLPVALTAGKDAFSEKQFFSIRKNRFGINETYKHYQLINQL